jgi:hypothetical protein
VAVLLAREKRYRRDIAARVVAALASPFIDAGWKTGLEFCTLATKGSVAEMPALLMLYWGLSPLALGLSMPASSILYPFAEAPFSLGISPRLTTARADRLRC